MKKKVMANYYGHEILVVNTWLLGSKLFVDGVLQDENKGLFSITGTDPLLTAEFEMKGQSHTVAVYFRAILTVEIKICVDGQQIGGEVF